MRSNRLCRRKNYTEELLCGLKDHLSVKIFGIVFLSIQRIKQFFQSRFLPQLFVISEYRGCFVHRFAHHFECCECIETGSGGHTFVPKKLHNKRKRYSVAVKIHCLGFANQMTVDIVRDIGTSFTCFISCDFQD